ncbi:hypothetical protein V5O48_009591 [Marasmius crinis-equi]|uniref:RING-type domain-containing protein n=1 Tax=Marasmius crinis-equi TaxID=585013 RepID=A0ABR3FAR9_9AGAR
MSNMSSTSSHWNNRVNHHRTRTVIVRENWQMDLNASDNKSAGFGEGFDLNGLLTQTGLELFSDKNVTLSEDLLDIDAERSAVGKIQATTRPSPTQFRCVRCSGSLELPSYDESILPWYRSKIWLLGCGHLVHIRCLRKLSIPSNRLSESLKVVTNPIEGGHLWLLKLPIRHDWRCPKCGHQHRSTRFSGWYLDPQVHSFLEEAGSRQICVAAGRTLISI